MTSGIKARYAKHLLADAKAEIVSPLHILGRVRER